MIDDMFVVDAVTHCLDLTPLVGGPPEAAETMFSMIHVGVSARDPRYLLQREQFVRRNEPEEFVWTIFAESQTDVVCYHEVVFPPPIQAGSGIEDGKAARELAPGRVFLYGGLQDRVFDTKRAIDAIDQHVEENGVIGIKFYPHGWIDGQYTTWRLDDEKYAFPLVEHIQKRGLRTIGIHKAVGASVAKFGMGDLEGAAEAFPSMNFEVVHGGHAFLDEMVMLSELPNIYVNLETTSSFLFFAPRRFAHVIGRLRQGTMGVGNPGVDDKILWGTGAAMLHPQPSLEKFLEFQIPEDMQEGYGYAPLTAEVKRKILGENWARMQGMGIETLKAGIPNDEMRTRQLAGDLDEPWSKVRSKVPGVAA